MIEGRKVYDPLTNTWSTGYWIPICYGTVGKEYIPVWQEVEQMLAEVSKESIEKLEKEVDFKINDEKDLEQALSILIELNRVDY